MRRDVSDSDLREVARAAQCNDGWGFVYIVQCGDARGPVKIGIAANLSKRIDSLQSGSPTKLVLRAFMRVEDPGAIEHELHQELERHRIRGEWFRWSPVIDGMIKQLNEELLG